jgi:outer membrane murein-binding lipoprotein Lpp
MIARFAAPALLLLAGCNEDADVDAILDNNRVSQDQVIELADRLDQTEARIDELEADLAATMSDNAKQHYQIEEREYEDAEQDSRISAIEIRLR